MKVFVKDEITKLLVKDKIKLADWVNNFNPNLIPTLQLAASLQLEITVDQVRAEFGIPPHSDPAIGAKYFWEQAT